MCEMAYSKFEATEDLKTLLLKYKAGDFLRDEFKDCDPFDDALPGEMDEMKIRIGLFGFTGAGKSSFVNSLMKCLLNDDRGRAVRTSFGGEGNIILEEYFNEYGFILLDTRGFMDLEKGGEQEILDILYGRVEAGDEVERESKVTEDSPIVIEPNTPLSDQLHVVLWFVNATDVRLTQGHYSDRIKFVKDYLFKLGVTIIPVVTFTDTITTEPKQRSEIGKQARELCGKLRSKPAVFITNYLPEESKSKIYEESEQRIILNLVKDALVLGERSVKTRQVKRALNI
ncbi:uncharacterized protein LOC144438927 [Glandiceps talaboti]